jgi:hypothetical protein
MGQTSDLTRRAGARSCGGSTRSERLDRPGILKAMSHEDAATVRRAYEVWNESGPVAVMEQLWAEEAV